MLFDIEAASKIWTELSAKGTLSTWDRLSEHMRQNYRPDYDEGLLRVIAYFGENFFECCEQSELRFQPGPMGMVIMADIDSVYTEQRYLLSRFGRAIDEVEHLSDYIVRRVNALHEDPERYMPPPRFAKMHEMLEEESYAAERQGDTDELERLRELADMMKALCLMQD